MADLSSQTLRRDILCVRFSVMRRVHSGICRVVGTVLLRCRTHLRLSSRKARSVLASSVVSSAVDGAGCASLLAVVTFGCLKVFWSPSLPVVLRVFRGDLLNCTPLHCFSSKSNRVAGPENWLKTSTQESDCQRFCTALLVYWADVFISL